MHAYICMYSVVVVDSGCEYFSGSQAPEVLKDKQYHSNVGHILVCICTVLCVESSRSCMYTMHML